MNLGVIVIKLLIRKPKHGAHYGGHSFAACSNDFRSITVGGRQVSPRQTEVDHFTMISPAQVLLTMRIIYSLKGQMTSISSKSAAKFLSDYWRSSSSKSTPFHLDWHQYAHVLCNLSQVGSKTSQSEAFHRKNEPFWRFLLVTAASLRFRPPAL